MSQNMNCHDCGTGIGEPYQPAFNMERCSKCSLRRGVCDCDGHGPINSDRIEELRSVEKSPKKKYLVTQLGLRQQVIFRTFVAELTESQEDDIRSGGEVDEALGKLAETMGIPWKADENDVWDEPECIEVDAEDVGDLYNDRYPVIPNDRVAS